MADSDDGVAADSPSRRARHYPLDFDAPFHRYEHRRLSPRDLLVHRLMADFMSHTRVPARFMDLWYGEAASEGHLQPCGDIEMLETMLSTGLPDHYLDGHIQATFVQGLPTDNRYTMGELVLDMVMRHYFEVDDAAMRVWMPRAAIPRVPEGPLPAPCEIKASIRRRPTRYEKQVLLRYRLIMAHGPQLKVPLFGLHNLRWLRSATVSQDKLPLYDGGACLPLLRQSIDRHAWGFYGARRDPRHDHWSFGASSVDSAIPRWPENNILRFVPVASWRSFRSTSMFPLYIKPVPLDLGLRPGRNRTGDGIWATRRLQANPDPSGVSKSWGERRRRRCTSEPPPNSFWTYFLPSHYKPEHDPRLYPSLYILAPRMTVAQLDRRSRRRSLSRTHIERMFHWHTDIKGRSPAIAPGQSPKGRPNPCANCASTQHLTSDCTAPCGHCGAPSSGSLRVGQYPNGPVLTGAGLHVGHYPAAPALTGAASPQKPHMASQCPVPPQNRCKCVPFPTFHTAARCGVPCRRNCGDGAKPGSFRHPNAMTCRARCCMCGLRGSHSGRECRLRRCRCGGAHLGQDCSWNPTCRVPGCDRFLCGVHCRECGSAERPFVAWRCWKCLGFEGPLGDANDGEGKNSRRRRRKKGEHGAEKGEGEGEDTGDGSEHRVAAEGASDAAEPPSIPNVVPSMVVAPEPVVLTPPTSTERQPRSIIGDPRQRDPARAGR